MDKLRAMQVFVRIVESGSLTAAAEALGQSVPSVVRSLAALEREVGVRLINRTTRRSSLPDEGREYYERCRRVLAEVEAADSALSTRRAEPRGRLRLTAPATYGRMHVAKVVAEYAAKYPNVEVEFLLLDRVVDLVEEGVDAAIRISHLPESSLVAVRLDETRRVLCASPAYLKRAGTPRKPADLASHPGVLFTGLTKGNEWTLGGKPPARVSVRPVLRTNDLQVAVDATLRGLGCGQFLCYQVEALVASRKLVRILGPFEPLPVPIQVVYPHARLLSPNVRAFVDLARERLGADRAPAQ
ncbi:MAG: LysR family transcriptional regulator [Burkholderiales bacterium]